MNNTPPDNQTNQTQQSQKDYYAPQNKPLQTDRKTNKIG